MKRFVKSFLTLSLFSLLSVWGVKADVIGSCVWTYGAGVLTISACPGSAPGILEPETVPTDTIGIIRFYPYYKHKKQIRKVIIEPGVTKIGAYAFSGMPYLEELVLPGTSSLTTVGDYAFFDTPFFSGIELDDTYDYPYGLPSTVQEIGDYAFANTDLYTFEIPKNCVSLGKGVIANTSVIQITSYTDNFKVSADKTLLLDRTGSEIVAAINNITNLVIPDGVTTIRSGAFYKAEKLESIYGGKDLTAIQSNAFEGATSLKSITLFGKKAVSVGANAFDPSIKSTCLVTAANDKTITNLGSFFTNAYSSACGENLYWHLSADRVTLIIEGSGYMSDFTGAAPWSSLKDQIVAVDITGECQSIGSNAFAGMVKLSSIKGSLSSITSVGEGAFKGATALASFDFNSFSSVSFLGSNSIDGLKINTLVIPSSMTTIEKNALNNSSLLSIIDHSSADIATTQFSATQKKSCIVWAKTVAQREKYLAAGLSESNVFVSNCDNDICQLNWHFDDATGKLTITGTGEIYAYEENAFPWNAIKTKIKEVQLPTSATLIPDYAFAGCISLSSIHHEGTSDIAHVKSIGSYAFKDASFSEFSLNSNITSIGLNPFDGDMELKKLSVATTAFNEQEKLTGLSKRDLCIHVTSDDPATADAIYQFFKGTAKFENVIYKNCGNTLSWDFNDGILIIRNTSNNRVPCTMWNFGGADQQPWAAYRNSITAVRLPDELTSISSYAFAGCKNLKSITLPLMVNEIGSHAFENTGITQIEIPASVNSIDAWGTHSLKQVTVDPANKRYTSRDADGKELNMLFDMGYVDLHICPSTTTNISLPGSLTVIGTSAFNGSVGKLTIPASVKTMNSWPTSATAIYAANEPTIYEKEIPATLLATKVYATTAKVKTAYEKMGFTNVETISSCGKNASYLFDKGVLTIFGSGDVTSHPWSDTATYIKRVVIEKGITSLCSEAFKNCTALKTLTLPDGLETINASFIEGCTSLKSLCIPNTVKELAPYVFKGSSLTHIEAQNGGSFISTDANGKFCNALYTSDRKTLVLAIETAITNELTTIREYAMAGSTIKDLNIPSSVTTIGAYAFAEASITNIYSSSVAAIPSTAFSDKVKERANVYVSDLNVKTVFSKAGFTEEKIVIAKGKCGDNLYYSSKNKNLIIFGSGDMDDYSSNDAPWSDLGSTITSISFVGEAITKIGDNAFESFTAIKTLSLPTSVTYIGQNAFAAAKGITAVEAGAGVPPTLSDGALTDEVYAKAKLIVPTASKATYSTAQNWENFGELLSKEEAKNPYDLNNDNKVNASDISLLKKNVR